MSVLELSKKSRNDHRAAAVSLFLWCEKKGYLRTEGSFNEAQKTTTLKKDSRTNIPTYTPEEMTKLLKAVDKELLPWLVIVAFSGIRSGELKGAKKAPMTWSMIKESQGVIDCPAHISKNRKRKLVPILPTLQSWLDIIEDKSPSKHIVPTSPNKTTTTTLGKLIGGWRNNALRHSYGSYRVAQTKNVAATALEMDNSETIIKDHYLEAKKEEEAKQYFDLTPLSIGLISDPD